MLGLGMSQLTLPTIIYMVIDKKVEDVGVRGRFDSKHINGFLAGIINS